jgi:hypothetical protein
MARPAVQCHRVRESRLPQQSRYVVPPVRGHHAVVLGSRQGRWSADGQNLVVLQQTWVRCECRVGSLAFGGIAEGIAPSEAVARYLSEIVSLRSRKFFATAKTK